MPDHYIAASNPMGVQRASRPDRFIERGCLWAFRIEKSSNEAFVNRTTREAGPCQPSANRRDFPKKALLSHCWTCEGPSRGVGVKLWKIAVNCGRVPALGVRSSPQEGLQSQERMDIGSRTMYSHHLVTCSFTLVGCVPQRDIKGGKTWVPEGKH